MNFFSKFCAVFLLAASPSISAYAKPNVTGDILMQFKADRALSVNKSGVSPNNAYAYVESNIAINFDKNWSLKTNIRSMPGNTLTTRNQQYPERYRTFFSQNRGIKPQDNDLMIEELKINFENEDLRVFAGKFDPTFGTAYDKKKRIGVFTSEIAEDYNLREKIGAGFSAFLENSKISFSTFFNDTTGLSKSAINDRGRAPRRESLAGNTGTMSSYALAVDGDTLFGIEDLYYNVGYRSLGASAGGVREKGYTASAEYLYRVGYRTSIIPFFEAVSIKNFTGQKDRNAIYTTAALIGKYGSWTSSISLISRHIKEPLASTNINDRFTQFSVGYKFNDRFAVDFTRANVKEGSTRAAMFGAALTYLYKF
jgi:hypothetical protein